MVYLKRVWSYFRILSGRTASNGRRGVGVFNDRVCSVRLMRGIRQGFLGIRASALGAQIARAR